jgi:hypothetical protein
MALSRKAPRVRWSGGVVRSLAGGAPARWGHSLPRSQAALGGYERTPTPRQHDGSRDRGGIRSGGAGCRWFGTQRCGGTASIRSPDCPTPGFAAESSSEVWPPPISCFPNFSRAAGSPTRASGRTGSWSRARRANASEPVRPFHLEWTDIHTGDRAHSTDPDRRRRRCSCHSGARSPTPRGVLRGHEGVG